MEFFSRQSSSIKNKQQENVRPRNEKYGFCTKTSAVQQSFAEKNGRSLIALGSYSILGPAFYPVPMRFRGD
jgi:hypothetical protein